MFISRRLGALVAILLAVMILALAQQGIPAIQKVNRQSDCIDAIFHSHPQPNAFSEWPPKDRARYYGDAARKAVDLLDDIETCDADSRLRTLPHEWRSDVVYGKP